MSAPYAAHEINGGAARLEIIDVRLKAGRVLSPDARTRAGLVRDHVASAVTVGIRDNLLMMMLCNNRRRCEHATEHDRNGNCLPS
jgi:hypothetical protein